MEDVPHRFAPHPFGAVVGPAELGVFAVNIAMLTSVREVQHHVDEVHDAMDARAMPATRLSRIVDELSVRVAEYSRNPSVIHVAFQQPVRIFAGGNEARIHLLQRSSAAAAGAQTVTITWQRGYDGKDNVTRPHFV